MRRRLRAFGLIAALLAAPTLAGTVLAERTALYEATLDRDPALKRYPALDAQLRDEALQALAEFKDWAAGNDTGRPYTFALTDATLFVSDRYVSTLRTVDFYTGGAHGNRGVAALTWDATRGAPVPLGALTTPAGEAAIATALRAAIVREVHGGAMPDFWAEGVEAALAPGALDGFTLSPGLAPGAADGLVFHFAPYAVGPYAAGAPTLRVPLSVFADALTAEGAALFGR